MKLLRLFSLVLLLACLLGPAAQPVSAAGWIYTVNVIGNGSDANPGDGNCATSTGNCTLRAAIQESNAYAGPNTVLFNIAGSGVHTITVNTGLPQVTETIKLDASSQPSCSVPCIQLSGAMLPAGPYDGLSIAADNSLVKGFIITSFQGSGIEIHGNGNSIESNTIGFKPRYAAALGNGNGIWVLGAGTIIGGTTVDKRNVISGNRTDGIVLGNASGVTVSGTIIQGNYIGTNIAGTGARANGHNGIAVMGGASNTLIGGTAAGAGNVISGNAWDGILLGAPGNTIQRNRIGTGASGTGNIGNGSNGIRIWPSSTGNTIGGTNTGRNRIAYNHGDGITLTGTTSNRTTILQNLIYSNTGLGIDLGNDGPTTNDALDADTGANDLQNYPVIPRAVTSSRYIHVRLYNQPSSLYTVEIYSSPAGSCDPSHYGEGKNFLGSVTVATDATGYVHFVYVSPVSMPVGTVITATATDSAGRTSEFSRCRAAY